MKPFVAYLTLDLLLACYLGMWNATVPVLLLTRFGTASVVAYEIALAACALVALPVAAAWAERLPRGHVMRLACVMIAVSGISRLAVMSVTSGVVFWVVNDAVAVVAFALAQPLLSVYPAETVSQARVMAAFRQRRVVISLGRISGPMLVAAVLTFWSPAHALWGVAILGCATPLLVTRLPLLSMQDDVARETVSAHARLRNVFSGFVLKVQLPAERFFTLCDTLLGVATASIVPMLIPQLTRWASLPESQVGWLIAAFVIGSIAGVAILHPRISRLLNHRFGYVLTWLGLGVCLAVTCAARSAIGLAAGLALAGAVGACLAMTGVDRRMIAMPPSVRIRVAGATLLSAQLASMLSFALYGAAFAGDQVSESLSWLWCLYASVVAIAAMVAFVMREPWALLKEETAEGRAALFYTDKYPEVFAEGASVSRDATG
ncbi:MFS transporter [Pandoraea sp. PE-S2T-3]|uniref:MFS transporter n=2 Tax=unclassified Pandoraea TaxID=2624094 RepID=UPI001124FE2A|nr:MFS transporter [Pandoraea sp. PE-S2T-3]